MNLRERLTAVAVVIAEEVERNSAFRRNLEEALGLSKPGAPLLLAHGAANVKGKERRPAASGTPKKGGRRAPSLVDPIELARQGDGVLREKLSELDLEQLKDVVAQHGMDPGKLVMKWKDAARIVDRIVELAVARSTKGEAFRAAKPSVEPHGAAVPAETTAEEPKA